MSDTCATGKLGESTSSRPTITCSALNMRCAAGKSYTRSAWAQVPVAHHICNALRVVVLPIAVFLVVGPLCRFPVAGSTTGSERSELVPWYF
jgi:hypothetical protein